MLTACSTVGEQASTPTTTVTVTATPAPEAGAAGDAGDAGFLPSANIGEADAWLLCFGATSGMYADSSTVYPYMETGPSGESTVTDNGDGSFGVLVAFAPTDGQGAGAEAICTASGTIGDPTVVINGGRDFG